ncbi:hypothetical protein [Inquilinus limosus]|uniref:Uncharacterized protein n=1 Tax=Inquilinus limosus MP06 TaxID=1398085 RepID=A0A0A0DE51_9PROT|nr:hypothetical protein [Inquilinus limosus]KGM36178.1 hypothetical protein P409_00590 [Inquilinus limosus MP06]
MNVNISIDIPISRIADLVCNCFEGSYSPWIGSANLAPGEHAIPGLVFWAQPLLYEQPRFGIVVTYDGPDDDEGSFASQKTITLEDLRKGLELMAKEEPYQFGNFLSDNDDAITADTFMQLVVLGEVVYG